MPTNLVNIVAQAVSQFWIASRNLEQIHNQHQKVKQKYENIKIDSSFFSDYKSYELPLRNTNLHQVFPDL